MAIFTFEDRTFVNAPLEDVWNFFSNPRNLEPLTPPELNLKTIAVSNSKAEAGTTMTYELKLLGLIRTRWAAKITKSKKFDFFEDEQVRGPYKSWKHTHLFTSQPQGTRIDDHIIYELPVPWIDGLINQSIIRPQLQNVFSYRRKMIKKYFKESET